MVVGGSWSSLTTDMVTTMVLANPLASVLWQPPQSVLYVCCPPTAIDGVLDSSSSTSKVKVLTWNMWTNARPWLHIPSRKQDSYDGSDHRVFVCVCCPPTAIDGCLITAAPPHLKWKCRHHIILENVSWPHPSELSLRRFPSLWIWCKELQKASLKMWK